MKRFITYLFTYENGRKGKNAGFIRTDVRDLKLEPEVHVQGLGRFSGKGEVYLLVKDDVLRGISLGGFSVAQGKGAGRFACDMGALGYTAESAAGIAVRFGSAYYAASSWSDEAPEGLADGKFAGREAAPEQTARDFAEENIGAEQTAGDFTEENAGAEQTAGDFAEENIGAEQTAGDFTEENAGTEQMAEISVTKRAAGEFKTGNAAQSMAAAESGAPRRIDIGDIRKLPKKNWYLCNNSFLIHGFFNYRYLVLAELTRDGEQKTYLGVPGIYEKPERMMAMLFGFPEFLPEGSSAPGTGSEPLGSFGYWLCLLEM